MSIRSPVRSHVIKLHRILALLAATLIVPVFAGCGDTTPATPGQGADSKPDAKYLDDGSGIRWVKGDVEAAFAMATAEQKPVFLYWGAAWCPPCAQIKATVFKTREFQDRSRLFVPVYLDGDTEAAQRYGEQFGVMGYPTVIVFAPDGTELTRISNGINIAAFAGVLDVALSSMRPVKAIVSEVLSGTRPTAHDCKLLAYYSWFQDNEKVLADQDPVTLFQSMAAQCTDSSVDVASRLEMLYLSKRISATPVDDDADKRPLTTQDKQAALAGLHRILGNPQAIEANSYALMRNGAALTGALTAPGSSARSELISAFYAAYDQLADDQSLFAVERLSTAFAKIDFERLDDEDAAVSEALRDEVRIRVAWADATITDSAERQSVINTAAGVLAEAGLIEDARALLLREIERSREPYYFMTSLADLAEESGDTTDALRWLKQAYDTSRGPATRLQWGGSYVEGLIRMTPDDAPRIEAQSVAVIGELEDAPGSSFYHRNARSLKRLESALLDWRENGGSTDSLKTIRTALLDVCAAIPEDNASLATCQSFLTSA